MAGVYAAVSVLLLSLVCFVEAARLGVSDFLKLPNSEVTGDGISFGGTKWALLIAGSAGYGNYRHQADICHAYQLLKKNGLRDENIVVFMADDIANNTENPKQGTIINRPGGEDVYAGVPKDYTGRDVNVANFLAALTGDSTKIVGGSGKVIASGPEDHLFVFYSDHGGPGILGMPTFPFLFADDVVNALITKSSAGGFKELVFYLEACEAGSIFEGLLPPTIHVYATTASNAIESSWGTYCPGMDPAPPPEYMTCLGDLYSVAWMEDGDTHNLNQERLEDQYLIVKDRTSNEDTFEAGSHVMQYGDLNLIRQLASHYMGSDPANENNPPLLPDPASLAIKKPMGVVQQRDADLLHLFHKFKSAPEGSERKISALEEITKETGIRSHTDRAAALIGDILLAPKNALDLHLSRPEGSPLVDDWSCFKKMVSAYVEECGALTQYGMRHTRLMANMCNAGLTPADMTRVAHQACAETTRPIPSAAFVS